MNQNYIHTAEGDDRNESANDKDAVMQLQRRAGGCQNMAAMLITLKLVREP